MVGPVGSFMTSESLPPSRRVRSSLTPEVASPSVRSPSRRCSHVISAHVSTHTRTASPGTSNVSFDEPASGEDSGALDLLVGLGERIHCSPSVKRVVLVIHDAGWSAWEPCSTPSRFSLDSAGLDNIEEAVGLEVVLSEAVGPVVPNDSASCCSR